MDRQYDALDRLSTITEGGSAALISQFDYVGPWRDIRTVRGNGSVLDKRNAAGTQTLGGADAGYDSNRRHVRHAWTTGALAPITTYDNTYNGPGGLGTNRRITVPFSAVVSPEGEFCCCSCLEFIFSL